MFLHKVSWTCGPSNTSVSVLPSHKSLFQVQALNTAKDVIDPQYCCLKLKVRSERTKSHFYLCWQLNRLDLSNFRWARSKWEWGQCWDLIYRWKGRARRTAEKPWWMRRLKKRRMPTCCKAPTGANQSEGRGGSQSLSDKRMQGLGAMDGSWMRGIETVPV